jgi:glucokinase
VRHAVGIDIGGTELRVALVDEGGGVGEVVRAPTGADSDPQAAVSLMARIAADVASGAAGVAGIGVCAPGPLDAVTGRLLSPPTLPLWHGLPLRDLLSQKTGLGVVLDNDAHCAARAEWRFGAGRGCTDFIYLTVSTGIGGGIVSDGRLLRGVGGLAGHVGHMTVAAGGEVCACGNRGCWEAVASGTALGREAQKAVDSGAAPSLARLAGTARITARHVADAARQGDAAALSLLAAEAHWLGVGLSSLVHIFAPERVVVGGGLSACLDLMLPGLTATIAAHALPGFRSVEIRQAELGPLAGLVGAAALALA